MDYGKKLSSTLKMQGTLGFYLYNKHAKIMGRKFAILTPPHVELEPNWRSYASKYLKIGYVPKDQPVLGIKPPAPFFQGKTLDGKTVNIKEIYKTKPVVVVIFSPRCKFCRKELDFLNSIYNDGDLKGEFEIVAISLMDKNRKDAYNDVILGGGRKIQVKFKSGELVIGYSQGYSADRLGFFIIPADTDSNNERIFVVNSATEEVTFL